MKIIVCDDQKNIYEELKELLKKFDSIHQENSELLYFPKPSLVQEYLQKQPADIVFMDLEFCDASEDGILWLKKMKSAFSHTVFIILTAYENRYKEGFEARAFRFMTKPIEERELFDYLLVSMEELQLREYISVSRRGIPHRILIHDICYLTAQSGKSELWTKNDVFFCDESLLQWEQRLSPNMFFRCHSKYLVNLTHVVSFANQIITLGNGEKIPVSRRKWKAFQLAYMKFDTKGYRFN